MNNPIGIGDLRVHVAKFGFDVFPPIETPTERTRLNMFFEEANSRWPDTYEELHSSSEQFEVSKRFGSRSEGTKHPTFVLTQRGPIFVFPLRLPPSVNETGLEGLYIERFDQVRDLFFDALPGRKCLRMGLVRELIFETGDAPCYELVTKTVGFGDAKLCGGESTAVYRDERFNVRVHLTTVEVQKHTPLAIGSTVSQPAGHGVQVELDVNNFELRPLGDEDIRGIVEKAGALWPEHLLKYLQERRSS